jgi:hypothetical protein
MFGFFKKKDEFPDLAILYYSILKRDFGMKEPYLSEFIKFSDISKTDRNVRRGYESPHASSSIKSIIKDYGFEYSTIVLSCNAIYMEEFKKGKIHSREYEYAVVGLLIKLKHITGRIDKLFPEWLISKCDQKWPNLERLVFNEAND